MDFDDPQLAEWMNKQGLKRNANEEAMRFAHRVFLHLVRNGKYKDVLTGYESRRPSAVCKDMTGCCGGLSLLFVAVMRANDVPARALFGRWAIPQSGKNGQYHVVAEFFVEKSGWVPVDVSVTMVHKPKDPNAYFGNADGQHMAFHVDTDLEPVKGFRHGWAQYLCPRWIGEGDFWKDHKFESKWDVNRSPAPRE